MQWTDEKDIEPLVPTIKYMSEGSTGVRDTVRSVHHAIYDLDGTLFQLRADWQSLYEGLTDIGHDAGLIGCFHDLIEAYRWADGKEGVKERMVLLQNEFEMASIEKSVKLGAGPASARWRLARGLSCSIFSLNTAEAVEALVGSWGFYPVVSVDRVTKVKPHPEGIERTLAALGISNRGVIFIGNSDNDRRAADEARIRFIHVEDIEEEWFK